MFQSSHRGTHTKLAWVLLPTNSSSITLSSSARASLKTVTKALAPVRLRCASMSQVSSICCTSTLSPQSSTSKLLTLNPQPKALVCNPPSYPPCVCEACACGIASVANRYIRVALRMRVCMHRGHV